MTVSVLMVTPAVFGTAGIFGGAERYVQSIASAIAGLPGRAFRVTVLGFTQEAERSYWDGSVRMILARTDSASPNRMDWYGAGLWEAIREHDIVHVHQPFTLCGEVALIAAANLNKTIVATDHGGGLPPADLRQHPASLVDRFIAVSSFSAGLSRSSELAPTDIIIGPATAIFSDMEPVQSTRSGALYVGRIMPHKGIDRLIKAAPADLPVKIAGRGSDDDFYNYLQKLASGKDVSFIPQPSDEDLLGLYAAAAVHVAPSVVHDYRGNYHPNSELMGITTLESLSCGTPVAVANTCSLPELIAGRAVGEVFRDDAELRSILMRARDRSWLTLYKPEECRRFALERYAPSVIAGKIADVYRLAQASKVA